MKMKLNALRVNAGLTQSDVAKQLGISKNTLIKWESYKSFPTVVQTMTLCKLYGCDVNDIFLPDVLAKSE
jgi:DNA-binding XRE family transcriptional regulator